MALALDATTLGTRFTVLALSVVYRGCAIPVAWTVLVATAKHAWRREWLRMLRQVRRAVPRSWTVIVLADRGLYARWLFRRITRVGWHPFLRINTGGTFRPQGQVRAVLKLMGTRTPVEILAGSGAAVVSPQRLRELFGRTEFLRTVNRLWLCQCAALLPYAENGPARQRLHLDI